MDIFDKTSAEKKSIGFYYQDYVALKYLLELRPNESIGIEVLDDIHLENISGQKTLIQVKHSLNGSNLTNKDIDLWKTLYNWSESIQLISDKEIFLILYTNKSQTQQSGLVQLLSSPIKNIKDIQNAVKEIVQSHENKDDDLYKYLTAINALNTTKAARLFNSIQIIYSDEEIIEKIEILLQTFSVPLNRIESVLHTISGAFSKYKYQLVKSHKKINITYDNFRKEMGVDRIIQLSRDCRNNFDEYYNFNSAYPIGKLEDKISYKQLKDIGFDSIAIEHLNEMAKTEAFLQSLINDGELTEKELDLIYQKAFDEWKSVHPLEYINKNYNSICEVHKHIAQSIYKDGMSILFSTKKIRSSISFVFNR